MLWGPTPNSAFECPQADPEPVEGSLSRGGYAPRSGRRRYRNLNSTATSTNTSTGVPSRRAGAKRH